MANLTIRNLPKDLVERIKATAVRRGHSMEQEVRETLAARYASRDSVLERIGRRAADFPVIGDGEIANWIHSGRRND